MKEKRCFFKNTKVYINLLFLALFCIIYYLIYFYYHANKLYPDWTKVQKLEKIEFVPDGGIKFNYPSDNSDKKSFGTIKVNYERNNCEIEDAYLYINVSFEENIQNEIVESSLRPEEDVCFGVYNKPKELCKHISMSDKKLNLPKEQRKFGFLYNLNDMRFLNFAQIGDKSGSFEDINLLEKMNKCNDCKTSAFVSSNRFSRKINKITIYYKTKNNCKLLNVKIQ